MTAIYDVNFMENGNGKIVAILINLDVEMYSKSIVKLIQMNLVHCEINIHADLFLCLCMYFGEICKILSIPTESLWSFVMLVDSQW